MREGLNQTSDCRSSSVELMNGLPDFAKPLSTCTQPAAFACHCLIFNQRQVRRHWQVPKMGLKAPEPKRYVLSEIAARTPVCVQAHDMLLDMSGSQGRARKQDLLEGSGAQQS